MQVITLNATYLNCGERRKDIKVFALSVQVMRNLLELSFPGLMFFAQWTSAQAGQSCAL